MIGFLGKEAFCDLCCYMCEGLLQQNCLMAPHMKMGYLFYYCLGYRVLLTSYVPEGLWKRNIVLTPEIYGRTVFMEHEFMTVH